MPTNEVALLARARRLGRDHEGRSIRERSGVSLRELAALIQANPGDLSRWERGVNRPRPKTAFRWLEAVEAIRHELANIEPGQPAA